MKKIINEQFLEYCEYLKEVEKEIIRKYKDGEDCSTDVKMLKEECIKMMVDVQRIRKI